MGKSAFAICMARNMAVEHKVNVAFFSLETSNSQLTNKLISAEVEIPIEKLKSGQLEDWDWQLLEQKIRTLEDAPLQIDDTPNLNINTLCSKIRRTVIQWLFRFNGATIIGQTVPL
jgi:replicative DNA helicase